MKNALTRAGLAVVLTVGLIAGAPTAAALAAPASALEQVDAIPEVVLTLDLPQLLNLLLAVVFPIIVGLVSTRVTKSWVKAVLLATISFASSIVSAFLAAALAGAPFDVISVLLTGLAAWLIAIATHLGFWKPTGAASAVVDVGRTAKHAA